MILTKQCSLQIFLLAVIFCSLGVSGQEFKCPPKNGFYPDPIQCDLYYHCYSGELEEKLCPDGLVFDDSNPNHERCDIPVNVDCVDRKELQEPKPSKGCPRANGIYRHWDTQVCDKFVNCVEGKANELPCPPGLIYDDSKSNCAWPADNLRTDCTNTKREILEDGFSCPTGEVVGPNGRVLPHPTFPHPEDCQKFYICRNGVTPQYGSCSAGSVYNDITFQCDEPENVPGCENWFEEEDKNKNATKKT
ncbi:protein obstructor-E-like [Planococcus citri]|uniref:protein obstructor-E-like n=1 Tax=Planococcus citri TaxID=170843 RepID=UPI0031F85654